MFWCENKYLLEVVAVLAVPVLPSRMMSKAAKPASIKISRKIERMQQQQQQGEQHK